MPNPLNLSATGIDTARRVMAAIESDSVYDRRDDPYAEYGRLTYKHWLDTGRQVLSMHPDLVREVIASESDKLYPEVWRALPYITPMVVFPEPVPMTSWNDYEQIRMLGFIIHGRLPIHIDNTQPIPADVLSRVVCDSNDPDLTHLAFYVVCEILDKDGKFVTYEYNRVGLPLDSWRLFTLGQVIEGSMSGFQMNAAPDRGWFTATHRGEFLRDLWKIVAGTSLYLCSIPLDVETVPRSRVARRFTDRKAKKVPQFVNVGWTVGPALKRGRSAMREKRESDLPGRTVAPHQRRAHFAIRWTGRDRTVPRVVFIGPTWIHKELLGLIETKTVRPVPKS